MLSHCVVTRTAADRETVALSPGELCSGGAASPAPHLQPCSLNQPALSRFPWKVAPRPCIQPAPPRGPSAKMGMRSLFLVPPTAPHLQLCHCLKQNSSVCWASPALVPLPSAASGQPKLLLSFLPEALEAARSGSRTRASKCQVRTLTGFSGP